MVIQPLNERKSVQIILPIVVYIGNDNNNECIYKYVSKDRYQGKRDERLLDEGVLHAAKFHSDGRLEWLPLIYGKGPLTQKNGFSSQADVLIETRRGAKLVGATAMDRPEDIEVDPSSQIIYAMLTNNNERKDKDKSNPRSPNPYGHILEMIPPDGNHAANHFRWDILIMAGNPTEKMGAWFHPDTSNEGWFCCPDNVAFNQSGQMWAATDGCEKFGFCDGLWAIENKGELKGFAKHFLSCPLGAELCGPEFTPDGKTLFVSIQHPGDSDGCNLDSPSSRWPTFTKGTPPPPFRCCHYQKRWRLDRKLSDKHNQRR